MESTFVELHQKGVGAEVKHTVVIREMLTLLSMNLMNLCKTFVTNSLNTVKLLSCSWLLLFYNHVSKLISFYIFVLPG